MPIIKTTTKHHKLTKKINNIILELNQMIFFDVKLNYRIRALNISQKDKVPDRSLYINGIYRLLRALLNSTLIK